MDKNRPYPKIGDGIVIFNRECEITNITDISMGTEGRSPMATCMDSDGDKHIVHICMFNFINGVWIPKRYNPKRMDIKNGKVIPEYFR